MPQLGNRINNISKLHSYFKIHIQRLLYKYRPVNGIERNKSCFFFVTAIPQNARKQNVTFFVAGKVSGLAVR